MEPDSRQNHQEMDEPLAAASEAEIEAEKLPEPEVRSKGVIATFREAFQRAKQNRDRRTSTTDTNSGERTARNRDRTKTLFAMVAGVVFLLIAFLGLFSSTPTEGRREQGARRGQPSLGRPEDHATASGQKPGSVTPLLSADLNANQNSGSDQLSPEDISGTSKQKTLPGDAGKGGTGQKVGGSNPYAIGNVQFPNDPGLEAYRQQMLAANSAPSAVTLPAASTQTYPPASPNPQPPPPAPAAESEVLGKASLVFVRTSVFPPSTQPQGALQQPTLLDSASEWAPLPTGSRLVARLQTAASTAVKAPVVAVIECHYERDGEIVIPAGTKAFGEMQNASRSGIVALRFHALQLPDGTTAKIDAGAVNLQFGPLKGQVTGTNRGKQFLARTLTGAGTIAAFAVGRPGGFSLSGPVDNSILLRERLSQNIAIAGEQELVNLAYGQDVVVTVPGNTRFYIVLHQGAGGATTKPASIPTLDRRTPNPIAAAELPSAAELRELIALKQELSRMYREVSATRTSQSTPSGQEK
jgi:hypothetical protein